MVSVDFVDSENKVFHFKVNNVDFTTMNTIRRVLGYCVPIYAVDEIEYFENDSVTDDDFLANRIGLCPINTPLDTTGKTVTLSVDKEGPCVVYTKDFISTDSNIDFVYKDIPVTKLAKNQKLQLDAKAILEQGRYHVKHSPVIISYIQLVNLNTLKGCDGCKACIDACPKKNLEFKSKKVVIKDQLKCTGCRACVDACPNSLLEMIYEDNFLLNVELIGQINVLNLVKKAKRYTKDYFSLLKKKLK